MRCRVPLLLCALLVAALVGAAPASAQPDAEETHLDVQLEDDGDARWTVVAVVPLEDQDDRESFEQFANEFEDGDHDLDLGLAAFERAAEEASEATGRDMAIRSVDREAVVLNESVDGETVHYGELRVSFTWAEFARVEDDGQRYVVDDAFNTTDGTWLQGLGPDQSLTIRSPPGYVPTTLPIGAEAGNLHWEGPQTFEPGYFTIVYQPTALGLELSTLLLAAAVLVSGAALALGLYLLWRRRGGRDEPSEDAPTPQAVEERAAGDGNGTSSVSGGAGGAGGASSQAGATVTDGAAGAGAEAVADEGQPDLELLSDEERVEYLLEQNGGRMKQASIVQETGWSNAKVSQLLSAMEDDDRIDKLRIGRENLISLPGEDVTDIGGDADDE